MPKLKVCKKCGRIKSLLQFYKNNFTSDGFENKCKDCRKLKMRRQYKQDDVHKRKSVYQSKWAKNNKEAVAKIGKKVREKAKLEVFIAYGGNPPKCKCCKENIYRFLQLDHINGGGTKERIKYGAGSGLYITIRKKKFPKGYQILCANCNHAKQYGICPHKLT